MLKKLLLVLSVLALTACATANHIPTEYAGPDAGTVVIGMGARAGTSYSSYSLLFKQQGAAGEDAGGRFTFFQTNDFYKREPDYRSSDEAGVVLVQTLPPGEYTIYNFNVFYNTGMVQNNYGSRIDIAIPFSVKPGATTYLGNYQANKLSGKNVFGLPLPAGAKFVVSNRLAQDLALAQARSKAVPGSASDATPDPALLGNPFFISGAAPAD